MDARLEEVKNASFSMMKLAVPTPNQATRGFLEHTSSFNSNTFLNFQDEEDKPHLSKRSRSSGASRRWEDPATCGQMQRDTPLLSRADEEAHAYAELDCVAGANLISPACSNTGGSSATTEAATSDCEGEVQTEMGVRTPPAAPAGAPAETAQELFTTVHVKNLPRRFTCYDLRLELDASGYEGSYNFAHVPISFADGISIGYGLINFRSPAMAARLLEEWQDSHRLCTRRWRHRKAMVVQAASIQGLRRFQTNVMTRRARRISNPDYKPWFAQFED